MGACLDIALGYVRGIDPEDSETLSDQTGDMRLTKRVHCNQLSQSLAHGAAQPIAVLVEGILEFALKSEIKVVVTAPKGVVND